MQEEFDVLVQTVDNLLKRVDNLEKGGKQIVATERGIKIWLNIVILSLFLQAISTFVKYVLIPFIQLF